MGKPAYLLKFSIISESCVIYFSENEFKLYNLEIEHKSCSFSLL